jgi:hypothetical protein
MVKKGTQKKKNIKRSSLKRRSVQHGGEEGFSYYNLTVGSKTKQTNAAAEVKKYVSSMLLDIFEGKKSAMSIADRFLKFARGKASLGIFPTRATREPSDVFTNIIHPIILTPSDIDMTYSNTTFNKVMLSKFLTTNVTKISVLQGAILKGNTELVRIIMDTARNWGDATHIDNALTTNIGTINYTSAKDLIYTSGLGTPSITVQKEVPVPSVDVLNEMGKILYGDFPDKVVGSTLVPAVTGATILQKYNNISAFRNKEMGLNSYINLVKNTDNTTIDNATYSIIFQYTQPPPYIEKLNTLLDAFTDQSIKSRAIADTITETFGKIDIAIAKVNNYFIGNIERIKDASAMVSKQKAKMEELDPGAATQVETLTQKGIELKNNIENAYQSIIDFLKNVLKYNERVNIQAAIDYLNGRISQSKDQATDRKREELTEQIRKLEKAILAESTEPAESAGSAGSQSKRKRLEPEPDNRQTLLKTLQSELDNLPPATNTLEQEKEAFKKTLDKLDDPTTGTTQEYSDFIQQLGAQARALGYINVSLGYVVVDVINQLITYINTKKINPTFANPVLERILQTSTTIAQALQTVAKNETAITQNETAITQQQGKDKNRDKFQELSQLYTQTVSTLTEYMTLVEEFDKTPEMTALIENTRQDSNITSPSSQKGLPGPGPGPGPGTGTAPGSSRENPLLIIPGTPFFIKMEGKTYQITPGKSTVPAG